MYGTGESDARPSFSPCHRSRHRRRPGRDTGARTNWPDPLQCRPVGPPPDGARDPKLVWRSFGSWIRTIRPGLAPSEQVVAVALRNTLPEFLATAAKTSILVKFIQDRLDLSRTEGTSLAA